LTARLHQRAADVEQVADLAKQLKAAREERGLSLSDMTELTGMDRSSLSRLETGQRANPTVETLARYARAVGKRLAGHQSVGFKPCDSSGPLLVGPLSRGLKVLLEPPHRFQEFLIGSVPQGATVEVRTYFSHGGDKLSCAHLGDGLAQLLKGGENFRPGVGIGLAHNRSFTQGELARLRRKRPITTTGTASPGASFAIRVARVTPSKISRRPSGSSYTRIGGIPSFDDPNRRIS
jgi:transcriptional regulator with XRE-family HTH domain